MVTKVYAQVDPMTKEFFNESIFNAWYGFDRMGLETERFTYQDFADRKFELHKDHLIVGGIKPIREALVALGFEAPDNVDYPEELRSFLGRTVRPGTVGEIRRSINDHDMLDEPVFIKPMNAHKEFTGHVVYKFFSLLQSAKCPSEFPIWISEVVKFVSEYRFFVHHHEIVGVGFYRGNPLVMADPKIVGAAAKAYQSSPVAYCLDFGVTEDGQTLLVEVNDGFAFGTYGLNAYTHAKMLESRWLELTGEL